MSHLTDNFYKTHIFICTNIKETGKCCGNEAIAKETLSQLKSYVKENNLGGENGVRISQSGCLGRCDEGPCAVIYPQGKWLNLNKDDVIARSEMTKQSTSH